MLNSEHISIPNLVAQLSVFNNDIYIEEVSHDCAAQLTQPIYTQLYNETNALSINTLSKIEIEAKSLMFHLKEMKELELINRYKFFFGFCLYEKIGAKNGKE